MVVNLASTGSNAKCYIVNGGGQSVPDWLASKSKEEQRRRRRNKGEEGQGIRLIQDFEFPEASNKIKTTRDGQYCLATGTYKPRMRIYDLVELGLKSERVTDSENVDFEILSDDWSKTLHLQNDKSVSVHTASSLFYSTRLPKHGRSLKYNFNTCDAIVGCEGNEVFRLNLDQGRFLNPLALEPSVEGVNALDLNPAHGLLACGTTLHNGAGTVEFWDTRSRTRAGLLHLPIEQLPGATSFAPNAVNDLDFVTAPLSVTSLASRVDGLNIAVGTSSGHTLLYDLRSNKPYTVKDQGYGLPVKKIEWTYSSGSTDSNEACGLVATVDSKVLKIWGSESTKNLVSINPPSDINDLHIYPESGLVMLANEGSPITSYFVPSLGQAPKWCRFLENMTEELEGDTTETLYEDYKFVDRQELKSLGMDHLIGTNTLKPYMHGFFVDLRLYTQARAIANPFAYTEYREKLIRERLEKERESRIRQSANNTKLRKNQKELERLQAVNSARVNRDLAEKIRLREEKEEHERRRKEERKKKAAARSKSEEEGAQSEDDDSDNDDVSQAATLPSTSKGEAPSLLTDSRFGALFEDPEFQVDTDSLEYAMLNPSSAPAPRTRDRQAIDALGTDQAGEESDDASDDSDEGDLGQYDPRSSNGRQAPGQLDPRTGKRKAPSQIKEREQRKQQRKSAQMDKDTSRRPTLVVERGDGGATISAFDGPDGIQQTLGQKARGQNQSTAGSSMTKNRSGRSLPRGSSLAQGDGVLRQTAGGGMEFSFVPTTTAADDKRDDARLMRKSSQMAAQKGKTDSSGRFGSGLEKETAAGQQAELLKKLDGEGISGRTKMRRGIRSASRNVTRGL